MSILVLDSHPLLALFEGEPRGKDVAAILHDASAGDDRLLMSVVNWGEVCYVAESRDGAERRDAVIRAMEEMPIELIDADRGLAARAARLKARGGLSYADCFAAALALREGAAVVTGDPEFERVEDQVEIRWLRETD